MPLVHCAGADGTSTDESTSADGEEIITADGQHTVRMGTYRVTVEVYNETMVPGFKPTGGAIVDSTGDGNIEGVHLTTCISRRQTNGAWGARECLTDSDGAAISSSTAANSSARS